MRNSSESEAGRRLPLSRIAHIVERIGLAMAGALCGLFVAAHVMRANIAPLDSLGFILLMCLVGITGFYLGIDIPRGRRSHINRALVEMLSAFGTFLAAAAAVISVYVIVFDDTPPSAWVLAVGCSWVLGASLQIGAGAIARLWSTRTVVG